MIDGITTGKVSVTDIVDNLTTNASNKPLSAAQGVALKALIDGIIIPEVLPNPNKLIFTGAVTGEYDGRSELNVNIPSGGSSGGGEIILIEETRLTTWDQNETITIDNISEYDMIGIEVYPNHSRYSDEYSPIEWYLVEESGTRNYTIFAMGTTSSSEIMGEGNVRRISINFDTGVITSVSTGYYYNWGNRGTNRAVYQQEYLE